MSTGTLTIDLAALCANWRALDGLTHCETAAVVKADGYGLGAARVARALATVGCRKFFVATAAEGAELRAAIGPGPEISVFSGHMRGDTDTLRDMTLTPMLNSLDQIARHFEATPKLGFGIQLDTGMNRLGLEWADWAQVAEFALTQRPKLLMSHLACADDPRHPMNAYQLDVFHQMTDGFDAPRSLAATGGMLLGPEYHFDLCRPGVGLYGGAPYNDAAAVAHLTLPIIQTRRLNAGEVVGYANSWQATRPSHIATVAAGYADGLHRALGAGLTLWSQGMPCPVVGRVSMDLITVDITDLTEIPDHLTVLDAHQTVDTVAQVAGTIGYEVLTSLGARYTRRSTS